MIVEGSSQKAKPIISRKYSRFLFMIICRLLKLVSSYVGSPSSSVFNSKSWRYACCGSTTFGKNFGRIPVSCSFAMQMLRTILLIIHSIAPYPNPPSMHRYHQPTAINPYPIRRPRPPKSIQNNLEHQPYITPAISDLLGITSGCLRAAGEAFGCWSSRS